MNVIDISDVTRPTLVHHLRLPSSGNDIEACGRLIAVALDGSPGALNVYRPYDTQSRLVSLIVSIPVGSKPDMLTFTGDCRTLLVANEGGTSVESGYVVDHPGSVTVLRLDGAGRAVDRADLDFASFDERATEYVERGVRWPYRGELSRSPTNFSQSMEPEYIALSKDETKAYICLQENNAIAVIDLTTNAIIEIYALGHKSWKNLLLDASDKDAGMKFASHDIYSMYQPDAIKYVELNGAGYLLTANEGDNLGYKAGGQSWRDAQRGKHFVEGDLLSDTVSPTLRQALSDDAALGRLQFSAVDGRSARDPSRFDRLFFFGGRSFSVFRAADLSLVYDSGDELARQHGRYYPAVFNADCQPDRPAVDSPADMVDRRSDKRGVECEALETGELRGRRLLFVGQERTSTVAVYSFPADSMVPTFESLHRAGGTDRPFDALLDERNLGDLAPEDLRFIPASDSPNGQPLLLVTSTKSGTLSIYEVAEVSSHHPSGGSEAVYIPWIAATVTALSLIASIVLRE